MARNYYGPLRDAHQQALESLNNHIEQGPQPAQEAGISGPSVQASEIQHAEHQAAAEVTAHSEEPERPEGYAADHPGWTEKGDMASQQRSAMEWVKANHEARLEALNQHIESRGQQSSEQSPDVARTPDLDREI